LQQANNGSGKDHMSSASNISGNNNSNNNNSNSDYSKKEEFRRYLEHAGVLDALTKVLVGLYEEPDRPQHAVEYIKRYIGAPANVDVEGLKRENEQLKAELEQLKRKHGISGTSASSSSATTNNTNTNNTASKGAKKGAASSSS
jgi:hypothetical protein